MTLTNEQLSNKSLKQLINDCHRAVNGQCRLEDKDCLTDNERELLADLYVREEQLREEFLVRVYNQTELECHDGLSGDDINSEAFARMEKRLNTGDLNKGNKLWAMGNGDWC